MKILFIRSLAQAVAMVITLGFTAPQLQAHAHFTASQGCYRWADNNQQPYGLQYINTRGDVKNLMPEIITLDYQEGSVNPLAGKHLRHFVDFAGLPALVSYNQSDKVFLMTSTADNKVSMISSPSLVDADGIPGAEIVGLCMVRGFTQELIALVKKPGTLFGQEGSGFVLVRPTPYSIKVRQKDELGIEVDALEQRTALALVGLSTQDIPGAVCPVRAYPFNADAPLLGVTGFYENIASEWSYAVNALFVGLRVQGDVDNLGRAIAVVNFVPDRERLTREAREQEESLKPKNEGASASLEEHEIQELKAEPKKDYIPVLDRVQVHLLDTAQESGALLGGITEVHADNRSMSVDFAQSAVVATEHLVTMNTTTALPYLIAHINHNDEGENFFYAMPLGIHGDELDGAKRSPGLVGVQHRVPQPIYSNSARGCYYVGRTWSPAFINRSHSISVQDLPRMVGGRSLKGRIVSVQVVGDALFVVCDANGFEGLRGDRGLFSCSALFDAHGAIVGWTPWALRGACNIDLEGAYVDAQTGSCTTLSASKVQNDVVCLHKTGWPERHMILDLTIDGAPYEHIQSHLQTTRLADVMTKLFGETGGIGNIFSFDVNTPGFSSSENQYGCLVATGYKKIALITRAQGSVDDLEFIDSNASFVLAESSNGTILDASGAHDIISVSGGALDELGPITSCAVVVDSEQAWLAVGGVGGVAILCHDDGRGWNRSRGVLPGWTQAEGMSFKKLGAWSDVAKLVFCQNNLFVLTRKELTRVEVGAGWVDNPEIFPVFNARSIGAERVFCHDVAIGGHTGVVACSRGLFVGDLGLNNDTNIESVELWTALETSRPAPVGIQLEVVSSSGDGLLSPGSQIYALVGSRSDESTALVRYAVGDTYNSPDARTIAPVCEEGLAYQGSFYRIVGHPIRSCATDGAMTFLVTDRDIRKNYEGIIALAMTDRGGKKGLRASVAPNLGLLEGERVSRVVRCKTTGSWIAIGSFGMALCE